MKQAVAGSVKRAEANVVQSGFEPGIPKPDSGCYAELLMG